MKFEVYTIALRERMIWCACVVIILACADYARAQTFKLLYVFEGGFDGAQPQGALLRDAAGNLYGTANIGGNRNCAGRGCGVIFALTPDGKETILHRFMLTDGALPSANLAPDKAGNVYSTVNLGGTTGCGGHGCGGVFKFNRSGQLTLLYAFQGGKDGANPFAGLILDASGNLYGTAYAGGISGFCPSNFTIGCGTVFKFDTSGTLHVLYIFTGQSDGAGPYSALLADGAGNLYGTASVGGNFGGGTVFKIDAKGNFSILHTFTGSHGDGKVPMGGLIRDSAGTLYGTTLAGGAYDEGTVFKLNPSTGAETVLYSFTGGADGQSPWASLVMDKLGNLFGTTSFGGTNGDGTVFELDTTGKETVLHSFNLLIDGEALISPLIMDAAGNLYGTADEGGPFSGGTAFEIVR